MFKKTITAVAIAALSISQVTVSYAAFPIPQEHITTQNVPGSYQPGNAFNTDASNKKQYPEAGKTPKKKKGKKMESAALLAFFLGTLGLHRFYLGYKTEGIMQAFTLPLFAAFLLIATTAGKIAGLMYFGVFTLGFLVLALCIWEIIDFVRIVSNDLKPKNGEYVNGWEVKK